MRNSHDIVFIPLGAASMGGAERSITYLARGMQDRGFRVLMLAERALERTYYPRFIAEQGLPIEWVDWDPGASAAHNASSAWQVFGRIRPRMIQFNISWRSNMWLIPVVARLRGVERLVGSMRAMPDPHATIPRRKHFGILPGLRLWHLPERIAGAAWAKALHLTISVNALDFPRRLVRDYGFPRDRITVIHNGVAYRPVLVSAEDRRSQRAMFSAGDGDLILGYFGRLTDEKGIQLIVEALARLPDRYRLIIAGDGPAESSLRARASALGVASRVRFLGFIRSPEDAMAACDTIIVPSLVQEACSRVIVEAMNQGVPVIGTKVGGTPELIDHGVEGWIVAPGDLAALESAILTLGEDPDCRQRMSRAVRDRIRRQFMMEEVIERYARAYAGLGLPLPLALAT